MLVIHFIFPYYKSCLKKYLGDFEVFKVIRHQKNYNPWKMAFILRFLPLRFSEKNFLLLFLNFSFTQYIVSGLVDGLLKITFFVFLGTSIRELKHYFDNGVGD